MRGLRVAGLAAAGASLLLVVQPGSVQALSPDTDVALDLDGTSAEGAPAPVNIGTAPLATAFVTRNGGAATSVPGLPEQGNAIRLPALDARSAGPRAVLRVSNTTTTDVLNPGVRDFVWGADFMLDAVSVSRARGTMDNGDNLVQRGLHGSGQQFKLELDARRPACRIENGARNLRVVLPVTVTSTDWYRATCVRAGNRLTVTLDQLDAAGTVVQSWSRTQTRAGGFGNIVWRNPQVPLTVGGKLDASGQRLVGSTDQFNGAVDNVVFDILDPVA